VGIRHAGRFKQIPQERLMRSALCLSGHLRSFQATFDSLKENVIDPLNCDIFIHTWDVIGAPTNKNWGDDQSRNINSNNYIDFIHQYYQPKKLVIESENNFESFKQMTEGITIPAEKAKFIFRPIWHIVSMYYTIYQANNLKIEYEQQNSFLYDRVVKCRFDFQFRTKLEISMFPRQDTVYIPRIATFCEECVNDQLAIGSSNKIDEYCDIYNHIVRYYRDVVTTARSEAMMKFHLEHNNIPIEKLDIFH
jgi:hypothetical protein